MARRAYGPGSTIRTERRMRNPAAWRAHGEMVPVGHLADPNTPPNNEIEDFRSRAAKGWTKEKYAGDTRLLQNERLLTPDMLWHVYKTCGDVRAAVDSIARRVSTHRRQITPTVAASDEDKARLARAREQADAVNAFLQAPNDDGDTFQSLTYQWVVDALVLAHGVLEVAFGTELVGLPDDPRITVEPGTAQRKRGWIQELLPRNAGVFTPVNDNSGRLLHYVQDMDMASTGKSKTGIFGDGATEYGNARKVDADKIVRLVLHPNTRSPHPVPIIETIVVEASTIARMTHRAWKTASASELPLGFLILTGSGKDTEASIKNAAKQRKGTDHTLRTITTPGARTPATWVKIDRDLTEVQFQQVLAEARKIIYRNFGVSRVEMGDTADVNRATAVTELEVSGSQLIEPMLEAIENLLNNRVIPLIVQRYERNPKAEVLCKFEFDRTVKLTPEQDNEAADADDKRLKNGSRSINELRQRDGLPPVEGGDAYRLDNAVVIGRGEAHPDDEPDDDDDPDDGAPGDTDGGVGQIVEEARSVRATDFPTKGDDKKVSLLNSNFSRFPLPEAERLKAEWPEIWDAGGNVLGNQQFRRLAKVVKQGKVETETDEEAVRLREAWAARHEDNHRLAGVVAQVKWLVVGSRGIGHMRDVIGAEKERLEEKGRSLGALRASWAAQVERSLGLSVQLRQLPSDWQPDGRFRNVRTLDLSRLGDVVETYRRQVEPAWRRARREVLAATSAAQRSGTVGSSAHTKDVDDALQALRETWSMVTAGSYASAAKVGTDAAEQFAGTRIDPADISVPYHEQAMSYLDDLLLDVKTRVLANITAVVRAKTTAEDGLDPDSPDADLLDAVEVSFDANEHRIDNWSGRLVEVATLGMARGLSADVVPEEDPDAPDAGARSDWWYLWEAVGDAGTCETCDRESAQAPRRVSQASVYPGGNTECMAKCRCVWTLWTRAEVNDGTAQKVL